MLTPENKKKVLARLKRLRGQLEAIERMVEEDRYCVDILLQISAVQGALSNAGKIILGSHVQHCVADAVRGDDPEARQRSLDELVDVFTRYSRR